MLAHRKCDIYIYTQCASKTRHCTAKLRSEPKLHAKVCRGLPCMSGIAQLELFSITSRRTRSHSQQTANRLAPGSPACRPSSGSLANDSSPMFLGRDVGEKFVGGSASAIGYCSAPASTGPRRAAVLNILCECGAPIQPNFDCSHQLESYAMLSSRSQRRAPQYDTWVKAAAPNSTLRNASTSRKVVSVASWKPGRSITKCG